VERQTGAAADGGGLPQAAIDAFSGDLRRLIIDAGDDGFLALLPK
jgi:hypothetical protein